MSLFKSRDEKEAEDALIDQDIEQYVKNKSKKQCAENRCPNRCARCNKSDKV